MLIKFQRYFSSLKTLKDLKNQIHPVFCSWWVKLSTNHSPIHYIKGVKPWEESMRKRRYNKWSCVCFCPNTKDSPSVCALWRKGKLYSVNLDRFVFKILSRKSLHRVFGSHFEVQYFQHFFWFWSVLILLVLYSWQSYVVTFCTLVNPYFSKKIKGF